MTRFIDLHHHENRGLTLAATKAQWPLMIIHVVYAVLAIVLAALS